MQAQRRNSQPRASRMHTVPQTLPSHQAQLDARGRAPELQPPGAAPVFSAFPQQECIDGSFNSYLLSYFLRLQGLKSLYSFTTIYWGFRRQRR